MSLAIGNDKSNGNNTGEGIIVGKVRVVRMEDRTGTSPFGNDSITDLFIVAVLDI
jgi:hypothetical protein